MSLIETVKDRMAGRPKSCCKMGTYECQVPMPLNGRRQDIDLCVADIVTALNAAGIITVASCCGHGVMEGSIMLEDGRELLIKHILPDALPPDDQAGRWPGRT